MTVKTANPSWSETVLNHSQYHHPTPYEYLAHLEEESMISGPLTRAIDALGDYGVQADIIRLRQAASHRRELLEWEKRIELMERAVMKERQAWALRWMITQGKLSGAQTCLIAANARTHLDQLIMRDPDEGEVAWHHCNTQRPLQLRGGALTDDEDSEDSVGELAGRQVIICKYC
jgi:hypothetical protein